MTRYLEDLEPGQVFRSPPHTVTAEAIKDFAARWDPQPFHLDEAAAAQSFFAGLAASGWHTAAITMRLLIAAEMGLPLGVIGAGVEVLKWYRPVRPGDVLAIEATVLETRDMKSRPGLGLAQMEVVTRDAAGQPVQSMRTSVVVPLRPPG